VRHHSQIIYLSSFYELLV